MCWYEIWAVTDGEMEAGYCDYSSLRFSGQEGCDYCSLVGPKFGCLQNLAMAYAKTSRPTVEPRHQRLPHSVESEDHGPHSTKHPAAFTTKLSALLLISSQCNHQKGFAVKLGTF